jgi:hypothetical protein
VCVGSRVLGCVCVVDVLCVCHGVCARVCVCCVCVCVGLCVCMCCVLCECVFVCVVCVMCHQRITGIQI